MQTGDYVDIKEARSAGRWSYKDNQGHCRRGHIVEVDEYCYTVQADDGEQVRDVKEHFRESKRA